MAPSFLKDLRRRSRASFRTEKSTDNSSSDSNATHSSVPTTKSSSTLGSAYETIAPPAFLKSDSSSNLQVLGSMASSASQTRPPISAFPNNRYSVSGMSGLGSPSPNSSLPTSVFAPKIVSISDNTWVYQKVLAIRGTISDPTTQALEGTVTISRLDDGFPPTHWPVDESHFKALVYLNPGPNRLRFDFTSPSLANSNTSNPIHSSYLTLHMLPPLSAPPLQLVMLLGKDSLEGDDLNLAKGERDESNLEASIAKFRMAAYLWQAFTSEQMHRNKLGRRTFRFEEEWVTGTSNMRDRENGGMRSEAKIHVLRSSKTVAELQALQKANGQLNHDLLNLVQADVRNYFKPAPGQKQYVSLLFYDALCGETIRDLSENIQVSCSDGDIQLSIFGSYGLQSYPSCIEEITPAFSNFTPTENQDLNVSGGEPSYKWEVASAAIGAHLQEIGRMFGCVSQETGLMSREFSTIHKSFIIKEICSNKIQSSGALILPQDEPSWHRLACLHFRFHTCFSLPTDPPRQADDSIQAWPVENGNVIITAASGVAYVEIFVADDQVCHTWQEFEGVSGGQVLRQIMLTEQKLRARLPETRRKLKMRILVKSFGGGCCEVPDFSLFASKASRLKLPNGKPGFRSNKLGLSQTEGSKPEEIILDSAIQQTKLLMQVKIYHGFALDGIEFFYEDSTSQLFGRRGEKGKTSEFNLDTRRGECITGFYVRSGRWVDGIAIMTSLGRKSTLLGNAKEGSGTNLMPPRGYTIAGVSGSCGRWVDSFGVILTR